MIYIAYTVFGFAMIQLLVAAVNVIFSQPFSKKELHIKPLVSVLIPARNEEKNITFILSDLQKQPYQNIEIFVFDDQSDDKTAGLVNEFSKSDKRIKLISSAGLPDEWRGKNYACYSLAKKAGGEYLLFLDADVRINGNIILESVLFLNKHKIGLLSIFPKQMMKSIGEWITVPNMNFILLTLLPLILVRKTNFSSLAAANGQFMLFNSEVYRKFQPHEKMKSSLVEDIQIAQHLKRNKIKVACLSGKDSIQCRMYHNFRDSVDGFSKNIILFFGNSFSLAILFWLITTFGFFAILKCLPLNFFYIYLLSLILTRAMVSMVSKQNILKNLVLMIPQQITIGIFIYKAIQNKLNKQYQWKGRNITYFQF